MNKQMVCPMCGWDVEVIDESSNIALCRRCKEWIVAEEDPNPIMFTHSDDIPVDEERAQEMYEADSWNYGVDNDK